MPKANYTPEAEQDLKRVTQYIAQDNLPAAMEWLSKTKAACELLAALPGIGKRIKTKRFGDARRHVVGRYLIYYRPTAKSIEILMVVHQSRDQSKLL